ncbi:unnamed protein product [Fusarium graminearum]|nr:unnamed protein product [Fusarium graminearum]
MNCQKCRQPLRLDGSLEDLNPAAYDVLVASASPQTLKKSSVPNPPLAQPQDQSRKSIYDRVSRNAGPPTFKRNHGSHPRDSSMSFVLLSESQMARPTPSSDPPTTPTVLRRASSSKSNADNPDAPMGSEMDRINRLFDVLSARSDVDHPICVECTEMLVEGLQKKLEIASRERDSYAKHLKEAKANKPSEEDMKTQEEALRKAERDRAAAMEELKKLESEKTSLDEELVLLEEESRQLDKEEEKFWRERNDFATRMADFQAERDSINAKYSNDSQLLEKLQRSNVYNDTFCISHDGSFATINGLRLGRLSNKPVDWPEINAAWGHALLLLVTVADKLAYRFDGYDPQPMGSTSRIIRYEVPSPSSSRLGTRAASVPPKRHILELYSSGDMPLGLTFMHRRFDNAMVGFLELVRQLGAFVHRQTEATGTPLSLPYKIDGDKIGDVSIKLGIAQDDGWTKACKLTLTCSHLLIMASCANCSKDASQRFIGCMNAPEYLDGDSAGVFYCGHECQTTDWPNHKRRCNNLKRRKSLLRAAKLLKKTLLSYKEVLFDWDLTEIEPRDDALILKHDNRRLSWEKPINFPDHLTSNPEHKEAALVKRMALHTLSILGPMTRALVKCLVCRLETVYLQIKNPPYPAIMDPPDAAIFDMMKPNVHTFGLKGVLFSLDKYITETNCNIEWPASPYLHCEIYDQQEIIAVLGTPPPEPMADILRITRYRLHFAELVKECVDNSLIKGSDAEFDAKMEEFSQKVKTHMSLCQSF